MFLGGHGINLKEGREKLERETARNKRIIAEGASNPTFRRKISKAEVPALREHIEKIQQGLNEFCPQEHALVSRALNALDRGDFKDPILQRYID